MPDEVVLLDGARTPMCTFLGHFTEVSAIELCTISTKAVLERTGIPPEEIDDVYVGNALQTSPDAIYGARHVALRAGIPHETPALTVNRLCGSGIQSIVEGARSLLMGESRTVLAGGMENMTQAPHVVRGVRKGFRLGGGDLTDALVEALLDSYSGYTMADTAENLAAQHGISREEQDRYALLSQQRTEAARQENKLTEEIVPVEVTIQGKQTSVDHDTHPRQGSTLDGLSSLPPAFRKDGTVTAGNASGIVDGAASVLLTTKERAERENLDYLGTILAWGIAGCDPDIMGIGPVPASRQALKKAGLTLQEIDLIEVNEAFAAQYLVVERALELDRDRVNVNGGAIALGHPLGMTGTRLVYSLLKELRRRERPLGLATACIGGGQGIALIVKAHIE